MFRRLLLTFFTLLTIGLNDLLLAQSVPLKAWDKTFGGNADDRMRSLQQTSDGGYIIGGYSMSGISGDKSQAQKGGRDYWVLKLDRNGSKLWDKTFGGLEDDDLTNLQQTADGGYILGGYSNSGQTGDKSHPLKGTRDYWIVKLDGNGNKVWDKNFGGSNYSLLFSLKQTVDGGFILGGYSLSGWSGDQSQAGKGLNDYWVLKLDGNGNKLWDRIYGGNGHDNLYSLEQTSDGGYILGGSSGSTIYGDKTEAIRGNLDYWVVRIDASGNKLWDKTYGGNEIDELHAIKQLPDGGFLLGGLSRSDISGDKTQASRSPLKEDFWLLRTDAAGNKLWDRVYGGEGYDMLYALQPTCTGGFLLGGFSDSGISGDKSETGFSGDFWVVEIDSVGNKVWDKTLGGSGVDFLGDLKHTVDGGFIAGGYSASGANGNKSQASRGLEDFWIVKVNPPCGCLNATIIPSCTNLSTLLTVNFSGIQSDSLGIIPWTLTYTINGVVQTITGTTSTFTLAHNAAVGSVYSLVSLVSGTCTANLKQSITIQPTPGAPQVTSGKNCGPGPVVLSATGAPSGGSYAWYNVPSGGTPLQTNSSGIFITPILNTSTAFYVAATNNAGCEGPRVQVIATITAATVEAGKDEIICADAGPVQLGGFSPVGGIWSGPGVSASGIFTPDSSLTGTQTLTYTIVQDSCFFTGTKQISIPAPVSLGTDMVACEGEEVTLKAQSSAGTHLWSDGSTGPTLAVRQSGSYWLQFTENGCLSSDTIKVHFKFCPLPFIPNIITQNNDGLNDTFKPQYLPAGKWHLQIFTRWGTRIFEAEDYRNNWPDRKIPDGVYYYLIRDLETGRQFKGWVEVVK